MAETSADKRATSPAPGTSSASSVVVTCSLALAISLAACLNAGLLYWQLRRADIFQPLPGWGLFLLKLVVAVAVMVAVLLGLLQVMPAWAEGEMLVRLLRLGALVAAGLIAYFGMLLILGFRPRDFARRAL